MNTTAVVKCQCGREWPHPHKPLNTHSPSGIHLDDDQIKFDWDVWAQSIEQWFTE